MSDDGNSRLGTAYDNSGGGSEPPDLGQVLYHRHRWKMRPHTCIIDDKREIETHDPMLSAGALFPKQRAHFYLLEFQEDKQEWFDDEIAELIDLVNAASSSEGILNNNDDFYAALESFLAIRVRLEVDIVRENLEDIFEGWVNDLPLAGKRGNIVQLALRRDR